MEKQFENAIDFLMTQTVYFFRAGAEIAMLIYLIGLGIFCVVFTRHVILKVTKSK